MNTKKDTKGYKDNGSIFDNYSRKLEPGSGIAEWMQADATNITKLIDAATSRGGAVRFGYSRDGGAYALGLYYGDQATTKYCRPSEDIDDFLKLWIEFFENLPMTNGVSPSKA